MNKYLRTYFFPILLILAGSVAFVFFIKNKVMKISKEVREINAQIITEKESIHILNAEYAFLTNPKRMKKLISKHLHLHEISRNQLIEDVDMQSRFDVEIKEYKERMIQSQKNQESTAQLQEVEKDNIGVFNVPADSELEEVIR